MDLNQLVSQVLTCLKFWSLFNELWLLPQELAFCQWNLTWSRWNVTVMVVAVTGLPTYLTWKLGFFESVFAISSSSPLPKHSLVFTFFSGFLNENFGVLNTCGGALTPSLDEAEVTAWCVLPGTGSSSGAGKEGSLSSQNIPEGSHGWFEGEVSFLWYSHHKVKEFKMHHKNIDWQSALQKTCLIHELVRIAHHLRSRRRVCPWLDTRRHINTHNWWPCHGPTTKSSHKHVSPSHQL